MYPVFAISPAPDARPVSASLVNQPSDALANQRLSFSSVLSGIEATDARPLLFAPTPSKRFAPVETHQDPVSLLTEAELAGAGFVLTELAHPLIAEQWPQPLNVTAEPAPPVAANAGAEPQVVISAHDTANPALVPTVAITDLIENSSDLPTYPAPKTDAGVTAIDVARSKMHAAGLSRGSSEPGVDVPLSTVAQDRSRERSFVQVNSLGAPFPSKLFTAPELQVTEPIGPDAHDVTLKRTDGRAAQQISGQGFVDLVGPANMRAADHIIRNQLPSAAPDHSNRPAQSPEVMQPSISTDLSGSSNNFAAKPSLQATHLLDGGQTDASAARQIAQASPPEQQLSGRSANIETLQSAPKSEIGVETKPIRPPSALPVDATEPPILKGTPPVYATELPPEMPLRAQISEARKLGSAPQVALSRSTQVPSSALDLTHDSHKDGFVAAQIAASRPALTQPPHTANAPVEQPSVRTSSDSRTTLAPPIKNSNGSHAYPPESSSTLVEKRLSAADFARSAPDIQLGQPSQTDLHSAILAPSHLTPEIAEPAPLTAGASESAKVDASLAAAPTKSLATRSAPGASDLVEQFSQRVQDGDDRSFEIELNPRELGRVTFQMRSSAEGMTVQILAERSETQDLVRRHIEDLARELRNLGHSSVTFGFGDPKQQAGDAWKSRTAAGASLGQHDTDATAAIKPQIKASQTGLDLRI